MCCEVDLELVWVLKAGLRAGLGPRVDIQCESALSAALFTYLLGTVASCPGAAH